MKILRKGKTQRILESSQPRWVGKKFTCASCGCKFQFEAQDKNYFIINHELGPGPANDLINWIYYFVPCPSCKTHVEVDSMPEILVKQKPKRG